MPDRDPESPEASLAIDEETRREIEGAMRESLAPHLRAGERLHFGAQWVEDHVYAVAVVVDATRDFVLTLEAAAAGGEADAERVALLLAAAAEYLLGVLPEYLEGERMERPPVAWTQVELGDQGLLVRGSVVNERLEAMADEFLRAAGEPAPASDGRAPSDRGGKVGGTLSRGGTPGGRGRGG